MSGPWSYQVLASAALLASLAPAARAGFILQPAAASASIGTTNGSPDNTRNQSGLSAGYTSLVTDFDAYIASAPTHNSFLDVNLWLASAESGNLDFDLGGTFTIESFALWNRGSSHSVNVRDFELLADDNAAFSSPTSLGAFVANSNTGPFFAVLPEVFTFAPSSASFVRMRIVSTSFSAIGIVPLVGEVAFEAQPAVTAAAPEPATLTMFGLFAPALLFGLRRRASRGRLSFLRTAT